MSIIPSSVLPCKEFIVRSSDFAAVSCTYTGDDLTTDLVLQILDISYFPSNSDSDHDETIEPFIDIDIVRYL